MSGQLESSKVEYHINKQCMNHLFYADDAVLVAPTVDALEKLINVCQDFARKRDMVYNFEKSECTAFIPNTQGHIRVIPCQLIHFFADPSPILMKFGKLGGQQKKLIHTKFQHISTIFNGVRAL